MAITDTPSIKDGCLMVRSKVVLTGVPENVVVSPASCGSAFIGATSTSPSSRLVFSLGILGAFKFLSLFRFKIWWMIPRVGQAGSEIPVETQMLLLEAKEESALYDDISSQPTAEDTFYILFLPVLDGLFRTSLQGTCENGLQICIESGDASVQTSQALEALFVSSGDNPFELIKKSIKILEKHKGTFCRVENKKIPSHLDSFGWCTWDAFYTKVHPQGIEEGLKSFNEGGCPPKFLIIDDGWQQTRNEFDKEGEPHIEGTQFATRLVDIKENSKFKSSGSGNGCTDLHEFIGVIKEKYGLNSKKSAVARASEDFMPREPTIQTLHIASVTFNSLLLGEIVVPDWDMFCSKHETAEFHGAARALGGCAVYVSDKPGNHDFKILKKLVLPDGSILRARYAGRPTRDCLFEDPVMDGQSLLKVWNLNRLCGVVGVFNCQGAGSWPLKQVSEDNSSSVSKYSSISGHVRPFDVEFIEEIAGENWNGEFAVYAFNAGSLSVLPRNGNLEVSLTTLQCEIYTLSPIGVFGDLGLRFAPIGLVDMYNSGGAVETVSCSIELSGCIIKIRGRGVGRFGVYSSCKPRYCKVSMKEEGFNYNAEDGLLTVNLQGESDPRDIEFVY